MSDSLSQNSLHLVNFWPVELRDMSCKLWS
jgi:hypothetical protein